MLEQQIEQDLKAALLAGDKPLISTLRAIKNTILYAKVAANSRDQSMSDDIVVTLLQKEVKKRLESAELYTVGGSEDKAASELAEKAVIEKYLPTPLTETEVARVVDAVMHELDALNPAVIGKAIAEVRQRTAGRAEGALIARLVKERLER